MADPFHLERFVDAQAPVYERVRQELKVRRKQSHWMWFIFPQIAGLGQSPMSIRFAIASLNEAKAYLVARFTQSEGYRLLSLTRACSVVKRQSAVA
jgi:uncharacterized protein (DUF1810 family)